MAGFFLTTAALRIALLYENSALTQHIRRTRAEECWVSPLSHAILKDYFITAPGLLVTTRKRGLRAVEDHAEGTRRYPAQYPYPNPRAVDVWGEIRSLKLVIPAYADGVGCHDEQQVGPDELLVFATAAVNLKPLPRPRPD